jgi:L-lysine 6-oxidase
MALRYAIHPSIGVARAGNSQDEFYLAPERIGGLPLACDGQGNETSDGGEPRFVRVFKDPEGRIKRQAARFKIFRYDDADPSVTPSEVTANDPEVAAIRWSAHLANKKAAWYQFSELEGNLMLGEQTPDGNTNSYQARDIPLRNDTVTGDDARRKLIIDPGPRHLDGPGQRVEFSRDNPPPDYKYASFPPPPSQGTVINTLGEMLTDSQGRLLILGGFGHAGGDESIDTFAGADTWHDDISDGPVNCVLALRDGTEVQLDAWCLVGSPKFAPELVNIVTLDDILFDVGVRYLSLVPGLYSEGKFDPSYVASYERDILPIIKRPIDYIWVSNVPSMAHFSSPPFDTRDASETNAANRQAYFSYFRRPAFTPGSQQNDLWTGPADQGGIPMMPLNSGSNSVSNTVIDKFLTLTETQYFLLGQWAAGKFTAGGESALPPGVHPLDQASVGNCVGGPLCPGIEVTWSTTNPALYDRPYHVKPFADEAYYFEHGLNPSRDECEGGGCEPGELTKRMAIPWQADFFQCTFQFVNFTDPDVNKDDSGIPVPPTYFAYWWPPQSPMYVISGVKSLLEQTAAGVPAGYQVFFPRGVNSFAQMIAAWSYLGFIVNENTGPGGAGLPNFVEVERNHDRFHAGSAAIGSVTDFVNSENTTFWPFWYLKEEPAPKPEALLALPGVRPRTVFAPSRGRIRHARR